MTAADLLFVYGTLRKGAGHPMHEVLREAGRPLAAARVRGSLVVVDWYPGLVPGGTGWVRGELWDVRDPAAWARLDAYEACSAEDPPPHEYGRERLNVVSDARGTVAAWAYVYRGPTEGLAVVPSGDWLAR